MTDQFIAGMLYGFVLGALMPFLSKVGAAAARFVIARATRKKGRRM